MPMPSVDRDLLRPITHALLREDLASWSVFHRVCAPHEISPEVLALALEAEITGLTPSKVWLIRQAARASLEHGRYKQAAKFIEMGQKIRPDDERFESLRREVATSGDPGL